MSDAKPYTMDDGRVEHIRLYGADDADDARIVATVRALDAAQAEVTALRARVAELEAQASCCRLCDAAEAERERDEWKTRAEAAEQLAEKLRGYLVASNNTAKRRGAEVERLKGIIRKAECLDVDLECAWCHADMSDPENTHERDCVAFTMVGEVRGGP